MSKGNLIVKPLQSAIDIYCLYPPQSDEHVRRAAERLYAYYNAGHFQPGLTFREVIFQDLCLPIASSQHWKAAVSMYHNARKFAPTHTPMRWHKALQVVQHGLCEDTIRFLRHAAQQSRSVCLIIESLLAHVKQGSVYLEKAMLTALIENLQKVPLKVIRPSFAQLLYENLVKSSMLPDLLWLLTSKNAVIPAVFREHSQIATDALQYVARNKVRLYRTEAASAMRRIMHFLPYSTLLTTSTAKEIDALHRSVAGNIQQEMHMQTSLKRNNWMNACDLFSRVIVNGLQPSPQQLCAFCIATLSSGNWKASYRVLQTHLDVVPSIPLDSFSKIVKYFIRLGKSSIAYSLMKWHTPMVVNDHALANLLYFLRADSDWDMLLSIYDSLQSDIGCLKGEDVLVSPKSSFLLQSGMSSVLVGYEEFINGFTAKQWKSAIATYQLMLDRRVIINYKILTKILRLCCRANRWEPALSIYSKVHSVHRSHRNIDLYAGYMANLHQCLCLNGKWQMSAKLYTSAVVYPSETCANLCVASTMHTGQWQHALSVLSIMSRDGLNVSSLAIESLHAGLQKLPAGEALHKLQTFLETQKSLRG